MNEFAVWAAVHPYYWFCGLPLLAAGLAWLSWQALSGQAPGRRRSALYGSFALGMVVLFLALAVAVRQDGSRLPSIPRWRGASACPCPLNCCGCCHGSRTWETAAG
nr:hypothetical protein [Bordetella hinzii]